MKKFFKICFSVFLLLCLLLLFYVNLRLGYQPAIEVTPHGRVNTDVVCQLHFLEDALHRNKAGENMQQLFPEGFLFIHALYALTWYDIAKEVNSNSPYHQKALEEINWVLQRIRSKESKGIFDQYLELEYGAFYTGWSNLVLGKKLMLQRAKQRSGIDIKTFQASCDNIAVFIRDSDTPFASSYGNAAWPADMVICLTSLAVHDRIFTPKYQGIIRYWLHKVQLRLDTATGLIPHYVDAQTGYPLEGARGSSQSLMNSFLPEIDSSFASNQFKKYKAFFLDTRLGLPGIREYPKGNSGMGDVDSGPVIWGIGGAASVVGLRTMTIHHEKDIAVGLRNSIESFGIGVSWSDKKQYLFGILPIADAFIGWSNSIPVSSNSVPEWRWKFLIYSIILAFASYSILYRMWKRSS